MLIYFLTGCASGIGRHMVEVLYRQGQAVVATDIDAGAIQQLTQDWDSQRVLTAPLDVTRIDDWQRVINRSLNHWGRIDVGMNIAGIIRPGYVAEFPPEDIDGMVDVNLKGVMLGTRLLAEQMVRQQQGHIVNVASLAGVAAIPGISIYSATKCAVRAFSIAAANELRKDNVRVSVVCPDLVDTRMLTVQLDYPEAAISFSGKRILTVQDVEQAIMHRALRQKQLDILLPPSRGWLAHLGNLFPSLSASLANRLIKQGRQQQQTLKQAR